jgi:hypothetical protein
MEINNRRIILAVGNKPSKNHPENEDCKFVETFANLPTFYATRSRKPKRRRRKKEK